MKRTLAFIIWALGTIFNVYGAKITGIVKDKYGVTIPFVSIAEKGTANGTMSDSDGNFILKVRSLPVTLSFNCVGYGTVERTYDNNKEGSPYRWKKRPPSWMKSRW